MSWKEILKNALGRKAQEKNAREASIQQTIAGETIMGETIAGETIADETETCENTVQGMAWEKEEQENFGFLPRIGKLHEQGARPGQQDCFGVSDESLMRTHGLLAVVADGMGGLSDGDKVSVKAVETILDSFTRSQDACSLDQQLLFLLRQAVESVNQLLGPSELKKSGSTLAMGLIRDGLFSFLSVGDSRICLYRNGILLQLNREHIFQNKLALDAANGEISLQEIYADSRRGGLVSFLGMGRLEWVDLPAQPVRLYPGDKLLLMSDGIYNALEEEELAACLKEEPEEAAGRMKQLIQEKAYANQDNYTAVIIEVFHRKEVAD